MIPPTFILRHPMLCVRYSIPYVRLPGNNTGASGAHVCKESPVLGT